MKASELWSNDRDSIVAKFRPAQVSVYWHDTMQPCRLVTAQTAVTLQCPRDKLEIKRI